MQGICRVEDVRFRAYVGFHDGVQVHILMYIYIHMHVGYHMGVYTCVCMGTPG